VLARSGGLGSTGCRRAWATGQHASL
jgi:hypothetical protein